MDGSRKYGLVVAVVGALAACGGGGEPSSEAGADGGVGEERGEAGAGADEDQECAPPPDATVADLSECHGALAPETFASFAIANDGRNWYITCEITLPGGVGDFNSLPAAPSVQPCAVASRLFVATDHGVTVDGNPLCCEWRR